MNDTTFLSITIRRFAMLFSVLKRYCILFDHISVALRFTT